MTEEEARSWLTDHVPRETLAKLELFVAMLHEEMSHQNLISASSAERIWARHVVDSAQLVMLDLRTEAGEWVDIGTGAGFPGLVVATISQRPVTLVESRPKRTAFLSRVVDALGLDAEVVTAKIQTVERQGAVISARAVASADALLGMGEHLSTEETLWLLPKGQSARSELADAKQRWQGKFHVERSVTDPESGIIVARNVRRRRR